MVYSWNMMKRGKETIAHVAIRRDVHEQLHEYVERQMPRPVLVDVATVAIAEYLRRMEK